MKRLVVSLALMVSLSSFANPNPNQVWLDNPSYGGNGCPAGSAGIALSPDRSSVSILFDKYVAEAGRRVGVSMGRKTCNIAIPVHVPSGFSVSIFKIDYRGFNNLPYGAYSRFNVEYFFAGTRGPSFTKTFPGGTNSDYTLTNSLQGTATIWSGCGQQVILRVNTSMMTQTNPQMDDAMSTVDSVDVANSGIVYHLRWQRC